MADQSPDFNANPKVARIRARMRDEVLMDLVRKLGAGRVAELLAPSVIANVEDFLKEQTR